MDKETGKNLQKNLVDNLLKKESAFRKIVLTNDKFFKLIPREDAAKVFNEELEELQEQEMTDSSKVEYLFFAKVLNTYSKFLLLEAKSARKAKSFAKRALEKLKNVKFESLKQDDERVSYYQVWASSVAAQGERSSRKKLLEIEKHIQDSVEKKVMENEKMVNDVYSLLYMDLAKAEYSQFGMSTSRSRKCYKLSMETASNSNDPDIKYVAMFRLNKELVEFAKYIRKMRKKYSQPSSESNGNTKKKKKKKTQPPKKTQREQNLQKMEEEASNLDEKKYLFDAYVNLLKCFHEYPNPKQSQDMLQNIQFQIMLCYYEMNRFSEGLRLLLGFIEKCQKVYGTEYKELEFSHKLEGKTYEKLGLPYYNLAIHAFKKASAIANSNQRYEESGKLKVRCRKLKQAMDKKKQAMGKKKSVVLKRRMEVQVCSNPFCGKIEEKMNQFKRCGRCGRCFYCCRECQVEGWKLVHKKECALFCDEKKKKELEATTKKEIEMVKKQEAEEEDEREGGEEEEDEKEGEEEEEEEEVKESEEKKGKEENVET